MAPTTIVYAILSKHQDDWENLIWTLTSILNPLQVYGKILVTIWIRTLKNFDWRAVFRNFFRIFKIIIPRASSCDGLQALLNSYRFS